NTVLVQYAIVGGDIVAFVLRRGRPIEMRSAPHGAVDRVLRLRRLFELNVHTVMSRRCEAALEQQAHTVLRRLHEMLIAPVTDLLEDCSRLIVVPQGVLHAVPFAALEDGSGYVIERFELALAPSASAIAVWRRKGAPASSSGALVVAHSAE